MGFPKKLGQVSITDYNPCNPGMPEMGPGAKLTGTVASHGERLIKGTLTIERQISPADLPAPMGRPLIHLRHFPSIVPGAGPSVCELVKLGATNKKADPVAWAGSGELEFFPSELEEHMPLAPKEVLGAYWFRNGYTFDAGIVSEPNYYYFTYTDEYGWPCLVEIELDPSTGTALYVRGIWGAMAQIVVDTYKGA